VHAKNAKKIDQGHHTVTGLFALHCNLANFVIVLLRHLTRNNGMQQMMQATYQVPSQHHPTAAELRWTSHLLSLQTTKFHTDSMIYRLDNTYTMHSREQVCTQALSQQPKAH